jgi:hypothetical protein
LLKGDGDAAHHLLVPLDHLVEHKVSSTDNPGYEYELEVLLHLKPADVREQVVRKGYLVLTFDRVYFVVKHLFVSIEPESERQREQRSTTHDLNVLNG